MLVAVSFYTLPHKLDLHGTEHIIAKIPQQHVDDFVRLNQRSPMLSASGVDRWRPLRLNSSYYRIKDNHWIPEYLNDPELMSRVQRSLHAQS